MSVNSLSKKLFSTGQKRHYEWKFLLALPVWVGISFFAAQFVVVAAFWVLNIFNISVASMLSEVVLQTIVTALVYLITFIILIGVPIIALKRHTTLETLGLGRLMTWVDIGLAPLAFIAYALSLTAILAFVTAVFPGFPADEAQNVGFKTVSRQHEYMLAFFTLVVMVPIVEELVFRGYLFGKLRKHVPVYVAVLATSLLFALAHGQWNVAIDTFVLGMFLAMLREVTGSIWAGILLHMIKNAIAFFYVFAGPFMFMG